MNIFKCQLHFLVLLVLGTVAYSGAWGQCTPVLVSNSDNTLCAGDPLTLTASITLPAGCIFGSGAPYLWSGPGTPGATASAQITVGGAGSGDYSVAVIVGQDPTLGAPGCPCTGVEGGSNVITVNPNPPAPSIGAVDAEICEGENLQLLYNGPDIDGAVYEWTGPNGFGSAEENPVIIAASPAASGGYDMTITDVNGCTSGAGGVGVTVNALPDPPIADSVDVCPDFPATLEATGAGDILWYDSPVSGSLLFTGSPFETQVLTQTTIFYAEVFDPATGCASDRVAVVANVLGPIPKPVATDTIVCVGDPATLSAVGTGTPGNLLNWYDAAFAEIPLETDEMPPAAQTYTTPFGLLQTTTFYVAEFDTLTGCESDRTPIKVVVNPEVPEPNAVDVEACEGENVTLLAEHGGPSEGDFYWFDAPTGGTLLGVGNTYQVPTSITATAGVYTFYVEEEFNGCTSPTRDEVTVTINALPALPTLTGAVICQGETAVLTASGSAGNTLNWYADASGTTLLFTGASFETQALNQNTTFFVRQENPSTGCKGDFASVEAIVNPLPTVPSGTDISICSSEEAVITVSGSGAIGTQLLVYPSLTATTPQATVSMPPANSQVNLGILAPGTYTYYIEENSTLTGCTSERTSVSVTVNEVPAAPSVVDPSICEGESANLVATASGGGSGIFNWYSDAAGTILLSTGASYSTGALTATTTYYVSQVLNGCESSLATVTVTVTPGPLTPLVSAPAQVCSGGSAVLTASGSGGLLSWYSDGAGTNLVATGSTFTTPALSQNTTYYVQETSTVNGCKSEFAVVTLEIQAAPISPSVTDITLCEGVTGTIIATASGTGTFQWFDSPNATTPIEIDVLPPAQAGLDVGPFLPGIYTYYVSVDNGDCVSERVPVTVTVTPGVAAPAVATPAPICAGATVVLSATPAEAGATIQWFDASQSSILATGSTYTVEGLTETTTFFANQILNGCESALASVTVVVNPEPLPAQTQDVSVCVGETATLTVSTASGTIPNWYADNAGTTLVASGTTFTTGPVNQNITYWVQVLDIASGCVSGLVPVNVTALPNPTAPTANNIEICEGETGEIFATGTGTGSLKWYNVAVGGVALAENTIPPTTASFTVGPLVAGVYTYYVEEDNGTCVSARTPVIVTVNPVPTPPVVEAPTPICQEGSTTIIASSSTNGTFLWFDAAGVNLIFTGNAFQTPVLTSTTSYVVKEEINGCQSLGTTVTVVVNPLPGDPILTGASICEGETSTLQASPSALGNTINWYADASGTSFLGSGGTYTTQALNQSTTFYAVEVNTLTGCSSGFIPVTVEVNELPSNPVVENLTLCEGETGSILATGSGNGSIVWYDSPTATSPIETDVAPPSTASLAVGPFAAGTYTFFVEENNGTCVSGRTPVIVTVNPVPVPPVVEAPTPICEEGSTSITASSGTNGNFLWFDATGDILIFTGNTFQTPVLTSTTSYVVKEEINGCQSLGTTVTVVVNPLPGNPVLTGASICEGETATLQASPSALGNTINWYADASGTSFLGSGGTYTTQALNQSTTFYAVEVNTLTGCTSEFIPVTVEVSELPSNPTVENLTLCEGETGSILATGSGNGSIVWYDSPTATNPLETDVAPPATASLSVGPFAAGTYTFYVEENNGTCVSGRTPVIVTVNAVPVPPLVAAPTPICEEGSTTITASSVTNGTFLWFDATETDLVFTGNAFQTPVLTSTTTYIVKEEINGCLSQGTPVSVIVNPAPGQPILTGTTVCAGETATLVATPSSLGNTINWYADASGTTLLGSGGTFTTQALNQTTTFYAVEVNTLTGCSSAFEPVTVEVTDLPATPSVENLSLCEGEQGFLKATGSGDGSILWYDGPESTTPIEVDNTPPATASLQVGPFVAGTYVYYVTELTNNCESERIAVTVTVLPTPLSPSVVAPAICLGATANLEANSLNGGVGEMYWYADPDQTNLLSIGANFETPALNTNTVYYVSEVINGCASAPTVVTVIVNNPPAPPVVDTDAICVGETADLTASAQAGALVNWYADPAGSVLLASGPNYVSAILTQNTTFWVQSLIPGTGCTSELVAVTVEVVPVPAAPSGIDATVCVGETAELQALGSGNGSLVWYDEPTGGFPLETDEMPPSSSSFTVGPFATTGTFVYYVEESNGVCSSERTAVAVVVKSVPGAPIVNGASICLGESAVLTASHNGGTSGEFLWFDANGVELLFTGNTFQTPPLNITTTYQVVEKSNDCESQATLVSVLVNPVPPEPSVAGQSICEGETATLVATTSVGGNIINWYADPTGSDLIASGNSFTTSELSQSTTFWLEEIVNGTGCKSSLVPVTVTVLPSPSQPASSNITICEGEVGTISAAGSGSGFLNWFSTPSGGIPLQSTPMPPANAKLNVGPFTTGVYVFYVEEDNGACVSNRTPITVTVVPKPLAPVATSEIICEGESASLQAISANGTNGDFNWYDGDTDVLLFTGATFNTGILTEDKAFIVREFQNGCESSATLVSVQVNPLPSAPTATDVGICEGESAELIATGTPGNFLNWYSDATGSNVLFTGTNFVTTELTQSTTFYVQEVVLGTGCGSELIPVEVTVTPQPALPTVDGITICENEEGELLASGTGSANTELHWYDVAVGGVALQVDPMGPATAATFKVGPFAAGTYTFYIEEVVDGGCASERTPVEVVVTPLPPEPSVNDTTICAQQTVTLVGRGEAGIYNWYDAAVDGNLLQRGLSFTSPVLTETTSFFISQEIDGCESNREEVVVNVDPLPATPIITSNEPLCEGDSLFLTAEPMTNVSYQWVGPNDFTSTVQNPIIPFVTEADHQGDYILEVIDLTTGCVSEQAMVFVEITPIPQTPSLTSNSPVCVGDDLIIYASEVFGAQKYVWTFPNDSSLTTVEPQITITNADIDDSGVYTVSAANNGCLSPPSSIEVNVYGLGSVPIVETNSPVCEGDMLELTTDNITGAVYNWTGPNGFVSNAQTPVIMDIGLENAGLYEVTITINDCPTSAPGQAIVTVYPLPVLPGIMSNSPVCQGDSIRFTAPLIAHATYAWLDQDGNQFSTAQNPIIPDAVQSMHQGNYTLVVTDTITGCENSAETRVFVDSGTGLVVLADNSGPVCEGESIQFEVQVSPAQPNATYEWYNEDDDLVATIQNPVFNNVDTSFSGEYYVTVNGNSGCRSGSMNVMDVLVNPGIHVEAGPDVVTITQGEILELSATGADVYKWTPVEFLDNPNIPNPRASLPKGTFVYIVRGTTLDGCTDTDTVTVIVEPKTDEPGVYDLFTPNGDGVNDFFTIQFIENLENNEVIIFNRGGIEVFRERNYQNTWDGTYRGRPLPEGTYWYVIRSRDAEFKGAVTLIR